MESDIKLYSSPISDCSARVRIALNLKQLPYNIVTVLLKDDQVSDPAYAEINPSQAVPTLCYNKITITQSIAAIEFLDEVYPDINRLLSQHPVIRAKVRTLASIIATDTHPLLPPRVAQTISDMFPGGDVMAWRLHWLTKGLGTFEKAVSRSAGTYCVGDSITLADVVLVPALWTAESWAIDLSAYPTISKVYGNLSAVEAFTAARQDPSPERDST